VELRPEVVAAASQLDQLENHVGIGRVKESAAFKA
jgi:hypothetical protein